MPDTVATPWTDDLPAMDQDALRSVFDELAGHDVDAARDFGANRKHVRRTDKQVLLDARRLTNALEHIGRLPEPGESYHLVTKGAYSCWHIVKAVLHLAAPATMPYLGIATLGFSKQNLEDLLALIDAGKIGQVDFLYSVYFKSGQREDCERLAYELKQRGQRELAMLQHAKVLVIELSDGRAFTVETSANLRSCASIEQFVMTHDPNLAAFHRAWLNDIFTPGAK